MDLPPDFPSSGGYRLPGGVDQTRVEVVRAADVLGGLRTVLLLVWAIASFGLMFFARDLQRAAGAWPFSFWLGAQGIVLVFVFIVGVYALLANRAERQSITGLPEDERR